MQNLLTLTSKGLYCPSGDFYIDPIKRVKKAVITHAHADHALPGMRHYLSAETSKLVLQARLGKSIIIQTSAYGKPIHLGQVSLTFYPAGHILGSAQILIEGLGQRWVVSGDYKTEIEYTCQPFEPVPCDVFITESTFAYPCYKWQAQATVMQQINQWWQQNSNESIPSIIYAYSLGKSQRIICGVDRNIGPIVTHKQVSIINDAYRKTGIKMPKTYDLEELKLSELKRSLIIVPHQVVRTNWLKPLAPYREAQTSGWLLTRKAQRKLSLDAGFVLSDHADWQGLLYAIQATGANQIYVTHGFEEPLIQYLRTKGKEAQSLERLKIE